MNYTYMCKDRFSRGKNMKFSDNHDNAWEIPVCSYAAIFANKVCFSWYFQEK